MFAAFNLRRSERLHEIRVEKVSSFLQNRCDVHDFGLLPVLFQVQPV